MTCFITGAVTLPRIAALELLEGHSHAHFSQMALRLGLKDAIGSGAAGEARLFKQPMMSVCFDFCIF